MAIGFIQIPKAILTHKVWDLEAICKAVLFELFMRSDWKPSISSKGTPVQCGQFSCSYQWLANHVHASRGSVQKAIKMLEEVGVITKEAKRGAPLLITLQTSFCPALSEERLQESKFTPPTVEQVKAFCKERGNKIDPEVFVSYYSSKGWLVGKTAMRSWKACVISWEKNAEQNKYRIANTHETDEHNWYSDIPVANLLSIQAENEDFQEAIDIYPSSAVAIGEQSEN